MTTLAETEGLCLVEVCYERQPECDATLYRLAKELQRGAGHHPVVPSLDHLSPHLLLREQLLLRLDEANVRVGLVEP